MEIIEEEDSSGSNLSTLLAPCCQSKVTSFLPVSGISAISGKFIAAIIRKRRRSSMTKSFVSLSSVCCHRRRRYVTHTHTSCWVWQFAFFFLPFRLATHHFNDMHELAASYWFILSGDVRACVSGVLWKKKKTLSQSERLLFSFILFLHTTTGKRMAVIQIEPFQQFAISERCSRGSCRFLRGNCTQVRPSSQSINLLLLLLRLRLPIKNKFYFTPSFTAAGNWWKWDFSNSELDLFSCLHS